MVVASTFEHVTTLENFLTLIIHMSKIKGRNTKTVITGEM